MQVGVPVMPRCVAHPVSIITTVLLGIGLLACGGSEQTSDRTDEVVTNDEKGPIPTAQNARPALDEALETFNDYCLAPNALGREGSYPIELFNPSPDAPSFQYEQLWALTQVGILDKTIAQGKRGLPVHRFVLTREGRAARHDIAQGRGYKPMFCYAVPQVVTVDSIKAEYTAGPNPLATVWFAFAYQNRRDWADSPPIQRTFSGLSPPPEDTIQTKQLVILADSAWLDRRLAGYERSPQRTNP